MNVVVQSSTRRLANLNVTEGNRWAQCAVRVTLTRQIAPLALLCTARVATHAARMGLPLEIMLLIAESAAWEECWENKSWVAGLMRVSRPLSAVVRPILYHCIIIDKNNYASLFRAVLEGVPGFALTRQVVVLACSMDLDAADPDMDAVLAGGFGHVQYVAGYSQMVHVFLQKRTTDMARAVYLMATAGLVWSTPLDNTMRQCTHLHIHLDLLVWIVGGKHAPTMLRELSALTYLALDIAYTRIRPATVYDQFNPYLPPSVQRFLFRARWGRRGLEFARQLEDLASERQDPRVWLEGGQRGSTSMDDVRLGLKLWELGVQLFKPESAAVRRLSAWT